MSKCKTTYDFEQYLFGLLILNNIFIPDDITFLPWFNIIIISFKKQQCPDSWDDDRLKSNGDYDGEIRKVRPALSH